MGGEEKLKGEIGKVQAMLGNVAQTLGFVPGDPHALSVVT